ncbi:MAG TPA: thiamine pyrophosphate-dependent enzyme [Anaerolineae bacterium]|nr:thiamine pyrophosphate-dependent enzyme [Anaerolineae bacterium]
MEYTSAQLLVDKLRAWGVEVVFGLPGDGINGIMEALRQRKDEIRFIQVRHEEAAALAAVGYAKFSGKLGVCISTTGPGAIHLLNGLYDAKLDQIPVLAITGMPYHDLTGTFYQQDVDTALLFKDVALYSERIMGPAHLESLVDQAVRIALAQHGVAHLAFPNDLQEKPVEQDKPSQMNQPEHTAPEWRPPVVVPTIEDLQRAAEVLNEAIRPVILIGSGARDARAELEQLADILGAPIAKALLGKDVLPDDSPYTTGTIGVFGTKATADAMQNADTLFLIGTSFPYISYLPKPDQARGVQIDINPARIGLRFPVDVGLVGDARETLRGLIPLLNRNTDRRFLEQAQNTMHEWWQLLEQRSTTGEMPMRPQAVAWELGKQLADDAIICGDSGQNTMYAAREIRIRGWQRFSCSGLLATMGCALPYAIGAQVAFPNRQVITFVGDGGLTMSLGELATCAKYELPVKIFVLKNNALGMIRWEQMMYLGNPEYGIELQDIDFALVAQACGLQGAHVERPQDVADAIARVLQIQGPALLEASVDPYEPIIPASMKPELAEKYAKALKKGQPNKERIGITLFRDVFEDFEDNSEKLEKALNEQAPNVAEAAQQLATSSNGGGENEPQQTFDQQREWAAERRSGQHNVQP